MLIWCWQQGILLAFKFKRIMFKVQFKSKVKVLWINKIPFAVFANAKRRSERNIAFDVESVWGSMIIIVHG